LAHGRHYPTKDFLQIQGIAKAIKPEAPGKPNLLVKPKFLIFKRKDKLGQMETLKLILD